MTHSVVTSTLVPTQTAMTASAPARVNLIGEHLDYNGGEVLPIAIDRHTTVTVRARPEGTHSEVRSEAHPDVGVFDARQVTRSGGWWDYCAGVVREMRAVGVDVPQVELSVSSDIPAGAGLSSSAALEMATAAALDALTGRGVRLRELALIAWRAETDFVGVACGIMDQFASALSRAGHALHIWCDTLETEYVPMSETVLIFDTRTERSLRGSAFNQRRAECEQALSLLRRQCPELRTLAQATVAQVEGGDLPPTLRRRALHVAGEMQRVREVVAALQAGEPVPGRLLYASHESLRVLYECSSPELDWFVERAAALEGVRGARLTGAGWGGCAIAVGSPEGLAAAADMLTGEFERAFGHLPRTWISTAAHGVRML